MWKKTTININDVAERSTNTITFEFIGDCEPQDVEVTKSCGCTSANWDAKAKQLHVVFTASKIPKQVRDNHQDIKKVTKMTYLCNDVEIKDVLTFIGRVVR